LKKSKEQEGYEKKLQIFGKLIINEYGRKNKLDLTIRAFSDFTTFQVEMCNKKWGDFEIKLRFGIKFTWKKLKAKIDEGILRGQEIEAGSAGRCPCCYDDLKDVYGTSGCEVCSAILCMSCVEEIRERGRFKCPLCRHNPAHQCAT